MAGLDFGRFVGMVYNTRKLKQRGQLCVNPMPI
jgi:hypothetical protein